MKVFAFLCLVLAIQCTRAFPVDEQYVEDMLEACDVSYEDHSFDCIYDIAYPSSRMDIDFDTIIDTLEGCGFSFSENSLSCFMGYADVVMNYINA